MVVVRIFFLRPGGGKVEEEGVLKGYGQEGGERELERRLKLLKEKGVIRGSSKVVVGWRFEGEQGKDGAVAFLANDRTEAVDIVPDVEARRWWSMIL